MTLQSEAGQIIVNQSRGLDQQEALIELRSTFGWSGATDAALREAKERQRRTVYGVSLVSAQLQVLNGQLVKARTTAIAARDELSAISEIASADLGNAAAGDDGIAALITLITAIDAAQRDLRAVASISYETYRDG